MFWVPKSFQNRPEIIPKSSQNGPRTGAQERWQCRLPFSPYFRASWRHLGPSWGHLGPPLAALGPPLAALGPLLASQNGAKMVPKSIQKSIKILMFFLIGFLSDFDRFGVPKWSQVGTKMGSKIDVNFERRFFHETHSRCSGGSFCRIKRVEVGNKNGAKIEQKMRSTKEGNLSSIFDRF